jgi:phenylalanyl-tRNA synthetase alpha subunit
LAVNEAIQIREFPRLDRQPSSSLTKAPKPVAINHANDDIEALVQEQHQQLQEEKPIKKKKNLKVKIKLPVENVTTKMKKPKKRNLQKCCMITFLLILFLIVTSILIYFFGS